VPPYGSGHIYPTNIPDEKLRQVPDDKGYQYQRWDRYRECEIFRWQRSQNPSGTARGFAIPKGAMTQVIDWKANRC
jgi:hypothetical protein